MVVPHRNERPAGARVLQVGVGEVGTVHRAVVRERRGQVVVAELVAVGVLEQRAQAAAAVLALRHLVRVIHHLVDEVAEVQHEAELLGARAALVLVDHSTIRVRGADGHVLAAHEREAHRARIAFARRSERAADAAAVAVFVGEAVPVLGGGREPGRHEAAGPVGVGGDLGFSTRDDVVECRILRDFDGE